MVAKRCFVTIFAVHSSHYLRSGFQPLGLCPRPRGLSHRFSKGRKKRESQKETLSLCKTQSDRSGRSPALPYPVLTGKRLILFCGRFCGIRDSGNQMQLTVLAAQLPYLEFQFHDCLHCFGILYQELVVVQIHTIQAYSLLLHASQSLRQSGLPPA